MTTAKKYLDILKEREPQLWKEPLKESGFTDRDLAEIEKVLGYSLPVPYREFLSSYKIPDDVTTVLVSFCGDSYACSWTETFSREENCYIPCRMMPLAQPLNLNGITSRETMAQTF